MNMGALCARRTQFLFRSFVSLLLADWWVTLDRLNIKKFLNLGWGRPQVAKTDNFNVSVDAKHHPKLPLTISNTRINFVSWTIYFADWWVTLDRLDIKKCLNLGWDRPQVAETNVFNVFADAKHHPKLPLTIPNTRINFVCLNYWFINIAPRLAINSRLLGSRKVLWVCIRSTSDCKVKGFQRASKCPALPRIACTNPKYKQNFS